jgi:hypothetical protein
MFKEYCIIFRRPGFIAVVGFGSSPTLFPPSPVSKLDQRHTGSLRKRDNLLTGEVMGKELARSRIL